MSSVLDFCLALLALATAFLIGFAIRRGSICLVAATESWIIKRKTARIRAFVVSAAVSGLLLLPVAWLAPIENVLEPTHAITANLVMASAMFGMGALINGGCAFGTLARFSGGQLAYGATIGASIVAAVFVADRAVPTIAAEPSFAEFSLAGAVALLVFAFLARPLFDRRHVRSIVQAFSKRGAPLRPLTAMLVIGGLGGMLYGIAGSWTHLGIIGQEARLFAGISMDEPTAKSVAGGSALIGGALFAAWHSGKFCLRIGNAATWMRCVLGGLMMGASAAFIPGGNGALIVHGTPSGAVHAWVAIAIIVATLALSFLLMRAVSERRSA